MTAGRTRPSPEVSAYKRNAARLTEVAVLHPQEKDRVLQALPRLRRRREQPVLEAQWAGDEQTARAEAGALLDVLAESVDDAVDALEQLAALELPELLGKVEGQLGRAQSARDHLRGAQAALAQGDFGAAGDLADQAQQEVWLTGGPLVVALNKALSQAAISKSDRRQLQENLAERRQAKQLYDAARSRGARAVLEAAAQLRRQEATGFRLAAEVLRNQVRQATTDRVGSTIGRGNTVNVVPPHECETFSDIGGLDDVKQQLRDTIGSILERPSDAARYQVVHNGLLFYGPPGTGKNLLSRALAGEYGLRYIRFSPAAIASAYLHEAAANLRQIFELARRNVPCLLYLDEIDTIASARSDQPSADHREVVTQLMVCLEEYRTVPGLVIAAGTNELDRLDPALREGRFDDKILVPLPDPAGRAAVLRVHLTRRADAVDWSRLDLDDVARATHGYSAAALETLVSAAAQAALRESRVIDQELLRRVIQERGGQHRISLEQQVTWADVVLADDTRQQILNILTVFAEPELARQVGVTAPAGLILFGPPGTGKTTVAKAMASQVAASFYEMSAADLLSKWAGESEQRVAKLFAQARANRPSIIFIDEIDALLRRRSADSTAKWEERVLSQFLRELDGLTSDAGVLLVGATNRIDTIDEAIVGRRLVPIELGLPDGGARLQLLRILCRGVKLAKDVDLRAVAVASEGMSGADLRRVRDQAGMTALTRVTAGGRGKRGNLSITAADLMAALDATRGHHSLAHV